ncbi:MAG: aminoacyl-tRNA hydrolase [Chloroflexota bacterium]
MNSSGPLLIVGLGNPGRDYRHHRHNVGFMLLDHLAQDLHLRFSRRKAKAVLADGKMADHKVILAKPQTFMNLAGQSVGPLVRFFQVPLPNLLVVCDDLDLPRGMLRFRPGGGSAGHRGLRSIFEALGSQDFPRLRIGIGRPPGSMDPAVYVLQDFDIQDRETIEAAIQRGVEGIHLFAEQGIEAAMNRCNGPIE